MTRYKNIYTSLNNDFNYLLEANTYWLEEDKQYNQFLEFVKIELINKTDLLILKNVARKDRNIENADKFINYLKKEYLMKVKQFCISWQLPLIKVGGKNG